MAVKGTTEVGKRACPRKAFSKVLLPRLNWPRTARWKRPSSNRVRRERKMDACRIDQGAQNPWKPGKSDPVRRKRLRYWHAAMIQNPRLILLVERSGTGPGGLRQKTKNPPKGGFPMPDSHRKVLSGRSHQLIMSVWGTPSPDGYVLL